MLVGGLFLIGKATSEIHEKLEGSHEASTAREAASFGAVIVQIVLIDIVFSLDSVITAVGMVSAPADAQWVGISVMVTAIVVAVMVMLLFAGAIANFVDRHPTMKILALSFLILIGVMLVAEGVSHAHSQGVRLLLDGLRTRCGNAESALRRSPDPVKLHQHYERTPSNETGGRAG